MPFEVRNLLEPTPQWSIYCFWLRHSWILSHRGQEHFIRRTSAEDNERHSRDLSQLTIYRRCCQHMQCPSEDSETHAACIQHTEYNIAQHSQLIYVFPHLWVAWTCLELWEWSITGSWTRSPSWTGLTPHIKHGRLHLKSQKPQYQQNGLK